MPSLVTAFVRFGRQTWSDDWCYNSDSGDCDVGHCQGCYAMKGNNSAYCNSNGTTKNESVLLRGLSEYVFKRDLKWCVPPHFHALACILEHSPVLEKLTLQMFSEGPEYKVEIKGSYNAMEGSAAISENLTIVKVKSDMVDERVLEVLNFLRLLKYVSVMRNRRFLQNLNLLHLNYAKQQRVSVCQGEGSVFCLCGFLVFILYNKSTTTKFE